MTRILVLLGFSFCVGLTPTFAKDEKSLEPKADSGFVANRLLIDLPSSPDSVGGAPRQLEVIVAEAATPEELVEIKKWASGIISEVKNPEIYLLNREGIENPAELQDLKKIAGELNPGKKGSTKVASLSSELIDLVEPFQKAVESKNPAKIGESKDSPQSQNRFKNYFKKNGYRFGLTLMRFVLNAGSVGSSVYASTPKGIGGDVTFIATFDEVALSYALPIGILMGSISGGFQFMNQAYGEWLTRGTILKMKDWLLDTRVVKIIKKRFGVTDEWLKENSTREKFFLFLDNTAKKGEELTKWYATEVVFVSLMVYLFQIIGLHSGLDANTFSHDVLLSAFNAVAFQGLWETAIAANTRHVKIGKTEDQKWWAQLYADLGVAGISFVSVGAVALSQLGFSSASWVMGAMGASGALFYTYVGAKTRIRRESDSLEAAATCPTLFKK